MAGLQLGLQYQGADGPSLLGNDARREVQIDLQHLPPWRHSSPHAVENAAKRSRAEVERVVGLHRYILGGGGR